MRNAAGLRIYCKSEQMRGSSPRMTINSVFVMAGLRPGHPNITKLSSG
jgi:hypothetical protein